MSNKYMMAMTTIPQQTKDRGYCCVCALFTAAKVPKNSHISGLLLELLQCLTAAGAGTMSSSHLQGLLEASSQSQDGLLRRRCAHLGLQRYRKGRQGSRCRMAGKTYRTCVITMRHRNAKPHVSIKWQR